jgi:alpha-beta hydrolase superfamily lysophospholipase
MVMEPGAVAPTSREIEFRSLDGLRLAGTFVEVASRTSNPLVLVHGGGATREEGGFFTRLADSLGGAGVPSLRFDLRAHGASEGAQDELTLCGVVNDIRSAATEARRLAGSERTHVLGTSFAGGLAAFFAAHHNAQVDRLVLLNPLIDYKGRFVDQKPYWHDDVIDSDAADELARNGFLEHSPTFRLGRALLNEVFYIRPADVLGAVDAPTLVVHGTRDTFIPVESSRTYVQGRSTGSLCTTTLATKTPRPKPGRPRSSA